MSHPAGMEPQTRSRVEIFSVAVGLPVRSARGHGGSVGNSRRLCLRFGMVHCASRTYAGAGAGRDPSVLCGGHLPGDCGGDSCADERFCRATDGAGRDRRHRGLAVAVVAGCVLFAAFFYLVSLLAVPAIVFFPAYAIYFFAGRYQALSLVLYPP